MIPDWNVVVTAKPDGLSRARALLETLAPVGRTEFFNVLVMRVEDARAFAEQARDLALKDDRFMASVARLAPADRTFDYQTPAEFEAEASEAVRAFAPALAGLSFHVRVHRRGFKGRLSSIEEERLLSGLLLQALEGAGTPGRVSFNDPDAIVAIDTVGQRAGVSLWTRQDLKHLPFLHLD
jgi:tRNA(Ser,Leu) C12 N-acetylase TAN1